MKKALLLSSILFGAFRITSYNIININIIFLQTTVTPKVDNCTKRDIMLYQQPFASGGGGDRVGVFQANRVTKWLTAVRVAPLDICNDIWRPKKGRLTISVCERTVYQYFKTNKRCGNLTKA